MNEIEIKHHNESMMKRANEAGAHILEYDGDIIVGFGTEEDYDIHAAEVINGDGYYDINGRYHRYPHSEDYE